MIGINHPMLALKRKENRLIWKMILKRSIRITVEKTIRFQRCLDVTPEQLEKIKTGESPLVDSLLEHFALEAEEPLNQELDYSVVNSDTEQVLVDWE